MPAMGMVLTRSFGVSGACDHAGNDKTAATMAPAKRYLMAPPPWFDRMLPDGNFDAAARFARSAHNMAGNGQVLQPEALGLEERDLVAGTATGRATSHDFAQRSNRAPIDFGVDEIAAFQLRHGDIVHDDAARTAHRDRIDLPLLRILGAHGVDMHPGPHPGAFEKGRIGAVGGGQRSPRRDRLRYILRNNHLDIDGSH